MHVIVSSEWFVVSLIPCLGASQGLSFGPVNYLRTMSFFDMSFVGSGAERLAQTSCFSGSQH